MRIHASRMIPKRIRRTEKGVNANGHQDAFLISHQLVDQEELLFATFAGKAQSARTNAVHKLPKKSNTRNVQVHLHRCCSRVGIFCKQFPASLASFPSSCQWSTRSIELSKTKQAPEAAPTGSADETTLQLCAQDVQAHPLSSSGTAFGECDSRKNKASTSSAQSPTPPYVESWHRSFCKLPVLTSVLSYEQPAHSPRPQDVAQMSKCAIYQMVAWEIVSASPQALSHDCGNQAL